MVEGIVARYVQTAQGERQIVAVDLPGDLPDLNSAAFPQANVAMQALSVATLIRVPHTALIDAADRSPSISRAFWRETVIDGAKQARWMLNLGRRDAITATAHLICELACRITKTLPTEHCRFYLPVSQSDLSDMLGLSVVHINRTLRDLGVAKLVIRNHRMVTIADWEKLVRFADFDPEYLYLPTGDKPLQ